MKPVSKLTDQQWAEIGTRLVKGEQGRPLAREFGVSESAVRKKFGSKILEIKDIAYRAHSVELELKAMPIGAQLSARELIAQLRDISNSLAGAASNSSATAYHLSDMARRQALSIPRDAEMSDAVMDKLRGVSVLTKIANDASDLPIGLIRANKDVMDDANKKSDAPAMARTLSDFYGA